VDLRKPIAFAAVVALLLGARGVALALRRRP